MAEEEKVDMFPVWEDDWETKLSDVDMLKLEHYLKEACELCDLIEDSNKFIDDLFTGIFSEFGHVPTYVFDEYGEKTTVIFPVMNVYDGRKKFYIVNSEITTVVVEGTESFRDVEHYVAQYLMRGEKIVPIFHESEGEYH